MPRLCLFLVLTNCASFETRQEVTRKLAHRQSTPEPKIQVSSLDISPPSAKVETELRIPVDLNSHVERWIEYFTVKDRERFQRFLDRGQLYRDIVENVLEENDLPAELFYLAMIESGYRTDAQSHAQAVGVWQFIAGTGTRYGLRIDRDVDERRDPIRATEAAAKYLRDLYNVFGSWHLAMAAYNAGEIRILRAVMKGRTRDFWELLEAKILPSETANYVPKFLAVVLIGKEPEKYGFQVKASPNPYPNLEAVAVPGSVELAAIAKRAQVPLGFLKRVNPHLNTLRTPAGATAYEIWMPPGKGAVVARFRSELERMGSRKVARVQSRVSAPMHVVRPGENLSSIAKRYKVSVGHLRRINNMRSTQVLIGARLRTQTKTYDASTLVRYKVRRGDNLTIIARKFRTSPQRIKARNDLKRSRIFVGQILKVDTTRVRP